MKRMLFYGFIVLALMACQEEGKKDIRDYYFPLKELEEGLVYEYRPVFQDSLTPGYWYYRSFLQDDGVFLTGTYYEYELVPLQLVREELVSNGMVLEDIYLYETDATGKQQRIPVEVLQDNVFPFQVSDSSGVFLYKIQWTPPQDTAAVMTLIKNRRYLKDTVVAYEGEAYDAVIFDVRELIEYDKEGVFEQQYGGKEVYAEGLGLVYYDKKVGGEFQWGYALHSRYPMSRLEETFKKRIQQQSDKE